MMLLSFLAGAVAMGFAVIGIFFLRNWRQSADQLFLAFALAFWLLAIVQGLAALTEWTVEERSWLYLLRLAAFSLIVWAIWRKNREDRR